MTQINQNNFKHILIAVQEAIKTKIALQNHKTRNNPLNAKSKTREVSILAKQQIPTIEQNYILMPPKLAHPALK